jgi:hypothetical protein
LKNLTKTRKTSKLKNLENHPAKLTYFIGMSIFLFTRLGFTNTICFSWFSIFFYFHVFMFSDFFLDFSRYFHSKGTKGMYQNAKTKTFELKNPN